ncbi:MAG: Adenylate cyclase, class 3, partial [Verrucomicrobiaceae bacterium]|nr:Adenylate cyclase, class 3 [Verrucomicrobiaceae bacterium]
LIGRSQDATIRVPDAGISRQHATLRREGRYFWVTDLGSANGTYVNEVAVTAARALRTGDRVQFGTSVYVFDQDETEGATASGSTRSGLQTQVLSSASPPLKTISATLLVGDLRDFTRISSRLTAEEVGNMLREWYADCEAILKPRGAVIDKFIGDGVFAYWPKVDVKSRAMAVEAAQLLSRPEANHSPTRKRVTEELGIAIQCNVGLHVGKVALGTMGRGVHTAVGEAVNVTFRIESLTRKLGTPVLASREFVDIWGSGEKLFEDAGTHPLKGQPEPVDVLRLKAAPVPVAGPA